MPRQAGGGAGAVAGAALLVAAALTALVAPTRLNLILAIDSPGAHFVVIPVVYWAVVAAAAAALARSGAEPFARALAQLLVVAFVTHMLLLLAASASRAISRTSYGVAPYWMYARLFYAAAIALPFAWAIQQIRSRKADAEWLALVPIALAAAVLAWTVVRHDLAAAAGGVVAGIVAGVVLRTRDRGRSRTFAALRRLATSERVLVGAMFVLALGLRMLYTARVMSDPDYIDTGGDGRFYDRLAMALVQGQPISENGYPLLMLGYVRFLAVLYTLVGHSYLAVCIVQSVIGAAAVVGIYAIGKPVFGVLAARIAALFTAVSFQLAFSAVAIGHQALDIGIAVLLVWLLIAAIERKEEAWWRWALAGVVFGGAIAVRETNSFFLVFTGGWAWWAMARASRPVSWRPVAALLVGAIVVLAPLAAPMVSTPERRMQLRKHFDRLATSSETKGREGLTGPLSNPREALTQLRERPGFVLRAEATAARKNVAMQFFTQPYGEFDLVTLRKESDYYYGLWCYAYLLTLVGVAVAVRRIGAGDRHAPALALMLGFIVFRTLPHLFLESAYRHRAPLEPFLILFCAAGVVAVLQTAWPAGTDARASLRAAS